MEKSYRRTLKYLGLLIAAVLVAAAPFFASVTSSINSNGSLIVAFDEKGLGNGDILYTVQASASASFICCNKGKHQPAASNKATEASVGAATAIPAPKNGRIRAAITAGVTTPEFCPSGQDEVLANVKYVSITIIDLTNSVTSSPPDVSLPAPITCS
ncbi:hypothetical protein FGG08_004992 [Glutinoglossum americanum]|uniref:Uncharacterized protein n=1 Tax=Glutinoglossum americanum TaxID=1670608 RepID=A0A9P8I440_9PEZI|nr:hypothetical protein FGG08_004992 [Glutinoglossum americanum]